ncbi:MAG: ABC transporter permease [Planctomycetota bacterium]|jgi:simple sugar transport system permease protein|nr:ABC transporter permease [Planctomycetota bacterium]
MFNKLKEFFGGATLSLFVTMVLVFLFMYLLNGGKYVDLYNIRSMASQLPIIGFLAVGMMFAMLTGGINLAIVSNANLNGLVICVALSWLTGSESLVRNDMKSASVFQVVLAIAAGIVISVLIGVFHGVMVAWLRIPALLVTLGTMTFIIGVNEAVTRGYTISGFPAHLTRIGTDNLKGVLASWGVDFPWAIPIPMILFILSCIVAWLLLNRTRFGFSLYMMGANETAAKFSGVNIMKITVIQYVVSALFASLTSLVMIGQLNSIKANYYESYVLVAVLACFLGGVDPNGGFGRLASVIIATFILQFISSGFNLMRMDPYMVTAMWGGIVLILIFGRAILSYTRRKLRRRTPESGAA